MNKEADDKNVYEVTFTTRYKVKAETRAIALKLAKEQFVNDYNQSNIVLDTNVTMKKQNIFKTEKCRNCKFFRREAKMYGTCLHPDVLGPESTYKKKDGHVYHYTRDRYHANTACNRFMTKEVV